MIELVLYFGLDQTRLIDATIKECKEYIVKSRKRKVKDQVKYAITFKGIYGVYKFGYVQGNLMQRTIGARQSFNL